LKRRFFEMETALSAESKAFGGFFLLGNHLACQCAPDRGVDGLMRGSGWTEAVNMYDFAVFLTKYMLAQFLQRMDSAQYGKLTFIRRSYDTAIGSDQGKSTRTGVVG